MLRKARSQNDRQTNINVKESKMKVKELIEQLTKFDEKLEVQFDFEEFQTLYIDGVKETTEDYEESNENIVVIY